jgi:hypothetical protein
MSDPMHAPVHLLGALALELATDSEPGRDALGQEEAGALAEQVARDLAKFAPEAASLELAVVGAHYDAVELLRPGWSLHQALAELAQRAPAGPDRDAGGRVIAFGAHEGALPAPLVPAEDYRGSPLRLVPFVLRASGESALGRLGARFERDLLDDGMAGAGTALLARDAFGLRIAHAHYMTVHDVAAMMAVQYEYAGLEPLWPLIESALLSPQREEWLDAPPEPLAHYIDGEVRIALLPPGAWKARYAPDIDDEVLLQRRFAGFEMRQRQFAAVLGAHAIPVTFVHCDAGTTDGM